MYKTPIFYSTRQIYTIRHFLLYPPNLYKTPIFALPANFVQNTDFLHYPPNLYNTPFFALPAKILTKRLFYITRRFCTKRHFLHYPPIFIYTAKILKKNFCTKLHIAPLVPSGVDGAMPRGIPFPSILLMKEMEQTEELNTSYNSNVCYRKQNVVYDTLPRETFAGGIHLFGDLEGARETLVGQGLPRNSLPNKLWFTNLYN